MYLQLGEYISGKIANAAWATLPVEALAATIAARPAWRSMGPSQCISRSLAARVRDVGHTTYRPIDPRERTFRDPIPEGIARWHRALSGQARAIVGDSERQIAEKLRITTIPSRFTCA